MDGEKAKINDLAKLFEGVPGHLIQTIAHKAN
jgi:hypothetical protein